VGHSSDGARRDAAQHCSCCDARFRSGVTCRPVTAPANLRPSNAFNHPPEVQQLASITQLVSPRLDFEGPRGDALPSLSGGIATSMAPFRCEPAGS
jgi:hypothetical protein